MKATRRALLLGSAAAAAAAAAAGGASVYRRGTPAITPERRARIEASPHYQGGEFRPVVPHTPLRAGPDVWKKLLFPKPGYGQPLNPLPAVKTDLKSLPRGRDLLVWFGHSSFYLQLSGHRILIDPVFSRYASPVPFVCRAFRGTEIYSARDLPDEIDVLALTHDHWDHLDYELTREIEPRVRRVVTGLGCGGYYEAWGYPPSKISEEDWDTEVKIDPQLSVWVLPTRHFSGRLLERNQTQYVSFAFTTPERRVFASGDGGYDSRFSDFACRFGGFDLAIIENGQYNPGWHSVHMLPEESARAAEEVGAKEVVPCHNSKYCLSPSPWKEPLERFEAESRGRPYRLLTPRIGEVVEIGAGRSFPAWWKSAL